MDKSLVPVSLDVDHGEANALEAMTDAAAHARWPSVPLLAVMVSRYMQILGMEEDVRRRMFPRQYNAEIAAMRFNVGRRGGNTAAAVVFARWLDTIGQAVYYWTPLGHRRTKDVERKFFLESGVRALGDPYYDTWRGIDFTDSVLIIDNGSMMEEKQVLAAIPVISTVCFRMIVVVG